MQLHDQLVIADAYITCRVSSESKARVRALAKCEGTNESALVRQLLEAALRTSKVVPTSELMEYESVHDGMRLNISIGPNAARLLRERARGRGMPPATYVSSLVRSHLTDAAPLPTAEYLVIRQVVQELTAISRHLNRIARATSEDARPGCATAAEMRMVLGVADTLKEDIKALVSANHQAWRTVHVQKAR